MEEFLMFVMPMLIIYLIALPVLVVGLKNKIFNRIYISIPGLGWIENFVLANKGKSMSSGFLMLFFYFILSIILIYLQYIFLKYIKNKKIRLILYYFIIFINFFAPIVMWLTFNFSE